MLAKVGYALPATTFNKKECETITRNLVQVALSKSGVNPHLPRNLFGDITLQGLGLPDLYVHQRSYKVAHFIKFISNMKHIARSLMQISYELLISKTGCMNWLSSVSENGFKELYNIIVGICIWISNWDQTQ
jgi:hypothetical protein